MYKPLDITVER